MLNSIKNTNTKPLYLVAPCQARKAWPRRHCLKTRTCALSIWSQQNLAQETKCFTQSNFVVIGTDRDRKTGALRALLAHNDGSGLNYAGAAFIALGGEERARFLGELECLTTSWAAFKSSRMHDA
jgi:hypothetical protein